jgi:hypothetical protein
MRKAGLMSVAIMFLFFISSVPGIAQNPVVVELFTSEGCSSCPPADAVLMQLSQQPMQNGAELILLGEHVDYWNYIGWTDRFSSSQFSQRQSEYGKALGASVYTPQMVIDGQTQFVGNDTDQVHRAIAEAEKRAKPAQVSLSWEGNGRLRVAVQSSGAVKGNVLMAVTEDGLNTAVAKGENGGRTLHHAAVVRQLREIGTLSNGSFESTVDVARNTAWNAENLKVAVLVQERKSMKILGASVTAWPK